MIKKQCIFVCIKVINIWGGWAFETFESWKFAQWNSVITGIITWGFQLQKWIKSCLYAKFVWKKFKFQEIQGWPCVPIQISVTVPCNWFGSKCNSSAWKPQCQK